MVSTEQIKALREKTGVSVMQCKKALEEASGDEEKALVILKKKGGEAAAKKSDRALGAGAVAAYVHATGTVGALLTLSSETDFVSKNETFRSLARDLAMQVTATNPEFLRREDIPRDAVSTVRAIFEKDVVREAGDKTEEIRNRIIDGKLHAYFQDKILLEQAYIKDPEKTVADLLQEAMHKFGERIEVSAFSRLSI